MDAVRRLHFHRPEMERPATWLLAPCLGVLAAACRFDAHFDGTSYACAAPTYSCPPGFACHDGRCTQGGDDEVVDGAPAAPDDGGPSDASVPPGSPREVTFGERDDSDHRDVTSDTTLLSADPDRNVGALEGVEIDADPPKVTLLRFDLAAIPPSATVVAASLDVVVFDPIESGAFRLHPLQESWSESAATWNQRAAGVPWAGPGASGASADTARLLAELAPRAIGAITVPLEPTIVQGWVAAPATNHGFVWISTSPDGRGGQLRSREAATASERPRLRLLVLLP